MSTNTERNGTNSGIKMKCAICSLPLEGVMIGCGDGTGSKYAHPECFYRKEGTDKDAEIASLREEVERLNDALGVESRRAEDRERFLSRAVKAEKEVERLKGKLSERAMITETIPRNLSEENSALRSEYEKLGEKYTTLRSRLEQAEVELGGIRGIMATYGRIEDTAENLVRKMCKDFDECLDRLEQAEARVEKVRNLSLNYICFIRIQ